MKTFSQPFGWLLLAFLVSCARAPITSTSSTPTIPARPAPTQDQMQASPTPEIALAPTQDQMQASPTPEITLAPARTEPSATGTSQPTKSAGDSMPVGLVVFEGHDGAGWEIYSMNPEGTSLTPITDDPTFATSPTMSLDGKWVAFRSNRDGDTHLFVMQADGADPRRITQMAGNKVRPSISADGSMVAYELYSDICLARTNAIVDSCLTNNSFDDRAPIFSPDGQQILFTSNRGESTAIYSMNIEGGNVTRLTTDFSQSPEFSRDGRRIVYEAADEGGQREIHSMNADGTADVRLTFDTRWSLQPTFSPDGSKIAFTRQTSTGRDIWIMNADGAEQIQLTFGEVDEAFPMFGPEGTRIMYLSVFDDDSALYIMNDDGSEQTRLTYDLRVGLVFPGFTFDWH